MCSLVSHFSFKSLHPVKSRLMVVSSVAKESRINRHAIKNVTTMRIYVYITIELVNTPTETQYYLTIINIFHGINITICLYF